MISVSDFYKNLFGQKVYKISLDAGCTCPNRDGSKGLAGCSFCSARGSGDFTPQKNLSITEQIQIAKKLVNSKFSRKNKRLLEENPEVEIKEGKYIAYFQNFTNTYGNPRELKAKWEETLSQEGIVGLALGSRPDCLNEEMLEILAQLAEKTFIQVELGLQTENDESALYFNRCYQTSVYDQAVKALHKASKKIHVVTHLIFGLPNPDFPRGIEDKAQILKSVKRVIQAGSDGIKITVLYILKGSGLENPYKQKEFPALSQEKYFELVEEALKLMPSQMVIHRLTGDPPKNSLIAPEWVKDKKKNLNRVNQLLKIYSQK
ncbi:MAG: TIGR01212 family radical SAM protein [Treponema sp.]|nr:TIGR01212 family radical SAM protein [Treponema sp.]